jgi:hypothetical protein
MIFLFKLLALPVTGPINGFRFILEQIRNQALAEMLSEEEIQSLLIESSMRHQAGEISDDEYQEIEDGLMQELTLRRSLSDGEYGYDENTPHEPEGTGS